MTPPIQVVLADDHTLLRDAVAAWLNAQPELCVVATCSDTDGTLAAALRHRPQVVLLDIDMPGRPAFELARTLRAELPDTSVIFLSAFVSDFFIGQALAAKAAGYLTKGESPESIATAIRAVATGEVCFSAEIRARIVIEESGVRLAAAQCARVAELTPRELEVLRALASALSRKEIAQRLHLSPHTVDRHVANLMRKLDIHDRAELCRFAVREGVVKT